MSIKNKTPPGFKGFEDVIDEFLPNTVQNEENAEGQLGYESLDFLEKELERLNRLDLYLTQKIPQIEKNAPYEKMIAEAQARVDILKTKVSEKLKEPSSIFLKTLDGIWNKAFN